MPEEFKNIFLGFAKEAMDDAEELISRAGLKIVLDLSYNFRGKKWLAVYNRRSGQIFNGKIVIGVNLPLIYSEMRSRGIENDRFNIEAQAKISIMHEVGHGLIDWMRNVLRKGNSETVNKIIHSNYDKEESLCEEFGEYFFPEATHIFHSDLYDAFEEIAKEHTMVNEITNKEITALANKADKNPTDSEKEAGNYRMGHVRIKGFDITIENPKGSKRYYKNPDGTKGFNVMKHHYGYFKRSEGYDGDAVDVFIGTYLDFDKIYVVDQNKTDGSFDESKVMLGFRNEKEAKDAYFANFSKDWKGFRKITEVSVDKFKEWLYDGKKQKKPFSEYKWVTKLNENDVREMIKNAINEIMIQRRNYMKKNVVKINESTLRQIITESVKKVLKEEFSMDMQSRVTPRNQQINEISSDMIGRASNKFWQKYGWGGSERNSLEKDQYGNPLHPKDKKPIAQHLKNFTDAFNKAERDEAIQNPLLRKAQEMYERTNLEHEIADWVDPPYGCSVNLWGEVKDENGGTWKFEGYGNGTNIGGGDIDIEPEEIEFTSPDGQTGSIPRP